MRLFLSIFFIITFHFSFGDPVKSEDKAEFTVIDLDHKKGLVNIDGDTIVQPRFAGLGWSDGTTEVHNNLIGYYENGSWGILNTKKDAPVTETNYLSILYYGEDQLIVSKKNNHNSKVLYGLVDDRGKEILAFEYQNLVPAGDRLIASRYTEVFHHYGLISNKGEVFIAFEQQEVTPISETYYATQNFNNKYGIFDKNGKQIIDYTLDSLTLAYGGDVLCYLNGKMGLFSGLTGQYHAPEYQNMKYESGRWQGQPYPQWFVLNSNNKQQGSFSYEYLTPFDTGVIKVKNLGAEALSTLSGELITPFLQFDIQQMVYGLAIYKYKGRYGVFKQNGEELLAAVYDSIIIKPKRIFVKQRGSNQRGWYIYNHRGEKLTLDPYSQITDAGEGYFKVKKGKYWGALNELGEEMIYCKYDTLYQFKDGRIMAFLLNENGILNRFGDWIVLPTKDPIELLDDDMYLVCSPYGSKVLEFPDIVKIETEYWLYSHGELYRERNLDLKYGLIDKTGAHVIESIYDSISPLQDDSIYYVSSEGNISFVTKNGLLLNKLDERFEQIFPMSDEFIGVRIDGKYGFVDVNGKLRIANRYEEIGQFEEGLAPVKLLGKWGFVDKRENLVVQPHHSYVSGFENDLCIVVKDDLYGIIRRDGTHVVRPEYNNITRLEQGGFVTELDGKIGLLDKNGELLILPRFHMLQDLGNGYVIVERKDKYGLLDSKGISVIPMVYKSLLYDPYNNLYFAREDQQWVEVVF